MQLKTICIDFDGVIHSYTSGWQGVATIPDPPVRGAITWLEQLIHSEEFDPVIYSSRSKDANGILAMKNWLSWYGIDPVQLTFPTEKPAAWLTVDDRAVRFIGQFPSTRWMREFKPWNRYDLEEDQLPCPMCWDTEQVFPFQQQTAAWQIICASCGMRGPLRSDEWHARLAWNTLVAGAYY